MRNRDKSLTRTRKRPLSQLQKLALNQQGLLKRDCFGTGMGAVEKAVCQIGCVQIDTISVVERAHHHVLWSRVSNYRSEHLAALLPRMNAIRAGEKHWFGNIDKKLIREVYKRIEAEGPLMARDFADTRKTNTGWWDWKPAKQALEKLFMQGDLMVVQREGFQKRYDLTENVLPHHIDTKTPDVYEEAIHLVETTLRAHGFASLKSFTYLRKGSALRASVRERLQELQDARKVTMLNTNDGDEFYVDAELLEKSYRSASRARLLSPFDNLVIQRERCRQIFKFDYQIECYVPKLIERIVFCRYCYFSRKLKIRNLLNVLPRKYNSLCCSTTVTR